jgi:hypothetical protein
MINTKLLKGAIRHLSGLYKNGSVAIRVGRHEIFFVADNHEVHVQVVVGTREPNDGLQRGFYVVRDFMNANSMSHGTNELDDMEQLTIDGSALSIGSWKQVVYTFMADSSRFYSHHTEERPVVIDVPWAEIASYAALFKADVHDSLAYRRYISVSPKYGFSVTDGYSIVQINRYKVKPWVEDLVFPLVALKALKELGRYTATMIGGTDTKWVFDNGIVIVKAGLDISYPNVTAVDSYMGKLTKIGTIPKKCPTTHIKKAGWSMRLLYGNLILGEFTTLFNARDKELKWEGLYDIDRIVKFLRKAKMDLELLVPFDDKEAPLVLQCQGLRFMIMPGKEVAS